MLQMKQRPRIYYTETDKALMWDRWEKTIRSQTGRRNHRQYGSGSEVEVVIQFERQYGLDIERILRFIVRP